MTDYPSDIEPRLTTWRDDTPACQQRIHFNNAGAGLMPRIVLDTIQEHLALEASLGGYEASDARSEAIRTTYDAVAALIGARAENIAITANATAAFIQAVTAFDFAPGDSIVTTNSDYTSYQIQLLSLAKRAGVRVLHAADRPDGGVDPDSVRQLVRSSRCRLVTVSWIPTHSGMVQDVESVGQICRELDVPYHVDACQAVGQLPINVGRLYCDYLSATARKFLRGPRGVGFLYVSDRALARGDFPLFVDMHGATWVGPDNFELEPTARRFEDFEFPYALVLGLGAAARYAATVGIDVAHDRSSRLAISLRHRLTRLHGATVLEPTDTPSAIVTVELRDTDATGIVARLRDVGVNTSATLGWFGLRTIGARGVRSAVRLSPHYYNTEGEVAEAAGRVERVAMPTS